MIVQMPPGGQSVGIAFEDVVLLARLLDTVKPDNPRTIFPRYEELRRPRVDRDYKQAIKRWEGPKTISWWRQKLREFFFWIYLAFFARHFNESFSYDIFKEKL